MPASSVGKEKNDTINWKIQVVKKEEKLFFLGYPL